VAKEKEIGKITHYFGKIGVAVIKLKDALCVGDEIHVFGHTSDFSQKVDSMQVEHEKIEKAKKGESIGLKVKEKVRDGDAVFKVTE